MEIDKLQEVIDFIQKYTSREFNWAVTGFSVCVIILIFIAVEFSRTKSKGLNFNVQHMFAGAGVGVASFMLVNLIFGDLLFLFSIPVSYMIGVFVRKKYFSFTDDDTQKAENPKDARAVTAQHSYVKQVMKSRKARPIQVLSVMDILLDYGYISNSQKETAEINGLFMSPDEMANQLLTTPVLSIDQLREATAIMNIIRREGRMLSREEALGILTQIADGRTVREVVVPEAQGTEQAVKVAGVPPDIPFVQKTEQKDGGIKTADTTGGTVK